MPMMLMILILMMMMMIFQQGLECRSMVECLPNIHKSLGLRQRN